jgi:hypothetical protein
VRGSGGQQPTDGRGAEGLPDYHRSPPVSTPDTAPGGFRLLPGASMRRRSGRGRKARVETPTELPPRSDGPSSSLSPGASTCMVAGRGWRTDEAEAPDRQAPEACLHVPGSDDQLALATKRAISLPIDGSRAERSSIPASAGTRWAVTTPAGSGRARRTRIEIEETKRPRRKQFASRAAIARPSQSSTKRPRVELVHDRTSVLSASGPACVSRAR